MKVKLGVKNLLSPMQTIIMGAIVAKKSNYLTIAWRGTLESEYVSISVGRERYSHRGIVENKTFSLNIPSQKMLVLTDYCGCVSGKKMDKASLFTNFYGKLRTAPMIEECPITMECALAHTLEILPTHDVFIGKIVETYCDKEYMKDGTLDFAALNIILYVMSEGSYWKMGASVAQIGNAHKSLEK
jgi:flavin reductase (DIM6/NTAB) family NADH-FMN oxidoreductase RutF